MPNLTRRDVVQGTTALTALAILYTAKAASAFPSRPGEVVVPWLDQPPPLDDPTVLTQLVWEDLDTWITPNEKFFGVTHLEWPVVDAATWKLEIGGLVRNPLSLTLDDLKARGRQEVAFTLECSGNHGFPVFTGGIGNANWAGTPLAPLLVEAGILDEGIEVVFWGIDKGTIELHDDIRDVKMTQNFARSMSLADAMDPNNLLAYEMNGEALSDVHGFPARLIAPGWYGIANVKWLKRIEVRDRRLMNRFMARDYVTIREETLDGQTYWTETSVGRARLKSAPARVTRSEDGYRVTGAAWGAPIERVEVQIDDGPWLPAAIDHTEEAAFAWRIWYLDWPNPARRSQNHLPVDRYSRPRPARDGRTNHCGKAYLLGKQRAGHAPDSYRVKRPPTSRNAAFLLAQINGRSGLPGWPALLERETAPAFSLKPRELGQPSHRE